MQNQKLTQEFRVRLQLSDRSYATITSSDSGDLRRTVENLVVSPKFEETERGISLTYSDSKGRSHSAWVSKYEVPENQSVVAINQARTQAQKVAA